MDVPNETADSSSRDHTFGAEGAGKVTGSLVGLASAEGELKGSYEYGRGKGREERRVRYGLPQVVKEIGESDFVVLIDDFHYMPREVQVETAKNLKEAVRQGVRICTATVPHRGDDVVRANPELRGRVRSIDLRYWPESDLRRIADLGFDKLNVNFDGSAINRFTKEAAGSPQLMQLVCLNAGFVLDIREQNQHAMISG